MLGFLLDMTTEFDCGIAPFVPPYFRTFMIFLLPFLPIPKSANSPGPDLQSMFLSWPTTVINSWVHTSWVLSYPSSILPILWINEVSIRAPRVLSQWMTKINSALSSLGILLLTFLKGFFLWTTWISAMCLMDPMVQNHFTPREFTKISVCTWQTSGSSCSGTSRSSATCLPWWWMIFRPSGLRHVLET